MLHLNLLLKYVFNKNVYDPKPQLFSVTILCNVRYNKFNLSCKNKISKSFFFILCGAKL